MLKAVCPGSYSPVTNGHLDIVRRASEIFDEVTVLIMVNSEKKYDFLLDERLEMAETVFSGLKNVRVDTYNGLLSDYVREKEIKVIIKGIRTDRDWEYEKNMAVINRKIYNGTETFLIPASAEYEHISSSAVRELARYGCSIKGFVPDEICDIIINRMKNKI